ncbi:MAG: extracellular solute-binding protein, partial [Clostridia bacterium]
MKKGRVLCLVLCIVFAFSVMLTACTPKTEPTPTPTATPTTAPTPGVTPEPTELAKPDRIEITKVFYFGDSTEHLVYKREYMEWFTQKYGIQLVVNYPSRANFIEVINLSAMSGDLKGLVVMFSVPELFTWANEGLIYPLTDMLKDNEVWNTVIPEFWKEDVTYQGEIWAIPSGSDNRPSYFARHIRGDWLDTLGLQVPDTIDQFYEAIYKMTFNDPNQSGSNDTIGMTARTSWLMGDIYMTFDARVNHLNDPMPSYNPNTELWEDPVIKPEMVEALTWVKKGVDEGIIFPEMYTTGASTIRGQM